MRPLIRKHAVTVAYVSRKSVAKIAVNKQGTVPWVIVYYRFVIVRTDDVLVSVEHVEPA